MSKKLDSQNIRRMHKDVSYHVNNSQGEEQVFDYFDEAAGFAALQAATSGKANLDIVVHSPHGAKFLGGDNALAKYKEDPEASVFERLVIKVDAIGSVS